MEVKVEAEQVAKIHNLQNFAGCKNSQPAKFYKLRKLATLQNFCSGPISFSLWLQFPFNFSHASSSLAWIIRV